MTARVRSVTAVAACAGALVTLVTRAAPSLDLGFENLAAHVAMATAEATIAVLVGYLLLARFRRRGRLGDLLLVGGLLVAATSDLGFGAIPAAAAAGPTRFESWSSSVTALLAAALFAAAAASGDRRLAGRARPLAAMLIAAVGALSLIALTVALLGTDLPQSINPNLSPSGGEHRPPVGNAALLALFLSTAILYAGAALGFVERSFRERDELIAWVALGAVLAAAGGVNYFLFPSAYSRWLYVGDYLALAGYLALLVGAGRELAVYQRGVAAAAVLEERRRLARELHDGLAQELAFISTQSRRLLGGRHGDQELEQLEQLALAAERALDESRGAIAALTRRLDEPLEVAVAQAAEDVADRVGISVRFDLDAGIVVPVATREALLRIVREAVTNTARHGRASQVTVSLSNGHGVRLLITDNGIGFAQTGPSDDRGFGLVSMRERAQALGAELLVRSRPGEGTQIEVVIP